mmetsp:Transcript_6104/g.15118  ORF Transcript_6104/g.15118 Transcript_6104/m.15118 type:complete len:232 (-) Transcript_6104:1221-1916(-)
MNNHRKTETPTVRLPCDGRYEEVSNIELELTLTNNERHDCSDACGEKIEQEGNSVASAKSHLSEKILRAVQSHQLRVARDEHRSRSFLAIIRYTVALSLCIIPVFLFALEMVPERCHICLDRVELNAYFVTSALCGGFGAVLLSHDFEEYFVARLLGGSVGSTGALYTVWMILKGMPPDNVLHALFLLVGFLGAMPGLIVYFLVKIISDECGVSGSQNSEDNFSSLTKPLI